MTTERPSVRVLMTAYDPQFGYQGIFTLVQEEHVGTYQRWGWQIVARDPQDEAAQDLWDVWWADAHRYEMDGG